VAIWRMRVIIALRTLCFYSASLQTRKSYQCGEAGVGRSQRRTSGTKVIHCEWRLFPCLASVSACATSHQCRRQHCLPR
jgi:hypothetical protein